MFTRLFFCYSLFLISFSLAAQNFPSEMPSGTIIFEGEVLNREGVRSTQFIDIPSIYTINWFSLDAIYDGNIEETTAIPVITIGGKYEGEFVIASHAPSFDSHYKYIASVKECTDCIEGLTVYVPINYVAEFQKEKFSEQRNALIDRTRIIRGKGKECKSEEKPILYISFGNINLAIDDSNIQGSVEVKTRTNEFEKQLVNLSAEVRYDTDFFGENAVITQTIQPNFTDSLLPVAVEQSYSFQSFNLSNNEAKFSLEKNLLVDQQNFIAINTILQPTMALDFTLPISALNNLPDALEDLLKIAEVEASFFCEDTEVFFEEIIIEQYPIGVYFKDGELGGGEQITYQFGDPSYFEDDGTYYIGIHASSTNPTRLRSGTIKINYNPDVFTPFQTPTSATFPLLVPIPQITSTGESSFEITFTDNDTVIDEFQEITDNTFLFTIFLEVNDCTQSANLSFDEVAMQGLSTYVQENNVNLPIVYQSVFAFDAETHVACCTITPDIEVLDPTNIVAGDAQILTIKGSGFGDYAMGLNSGENGTGSSVLFHNGGYFPSGSRPEFIAAGEQDFVLWTDSEIQVRVASIDNGGDPNNSPGSGFLKVRNRCNEIYISDEELKIPYALKNLRSEGKAYRVGLRDSSPGSGAADGYIFEFDPSVVGPFANSNNIKDLFGEALERWCAQTEIRFKKKAEINEQGLPGAEAGDGRNTVLVRDIPDFEGAFTSFGLISGQINCGLNTNSLNAGYIVTEIDIVVDEGGFTNQPYIVREALMHELGHAQMLGHAWCEGGADCLMYPAGGFLVTGITDNDAEGANRVTTTSDLIINQSGQCALNEESISNVIPISDGNCGNTNGTTEIDLSSLKLYPNPTNSIVKVDEVSEFSEYVLRNAQGRIVQKGTIDTNSFQLYLRGNPSGVYLLMLTNDSYFGYLKIIKI